MHTLKLSVSLPHADHGMELHLSSDDSACDVVIALPTQATRTAFDQRPRDTGSPSASNDDYVLGGYAGI